jgi:hypothetical protein
MNEFNLISFHCNILDNPTEQEVIDLYHKLLWSTQVTTTTKQYTLVSLIKLSTRLRSGQEYVYNIFCLLLYTISISKWL